MFQSIFIQGPSSQVVEVVTVDNLDLKAGGSKLPWNVSTSVPVYHFTQHLIPEDLSLCQHHCENVRSYIPYPVHKSQPPNFMLILLNPFHTLGPISWRSILILIMKPTRCTASRIYLMKYSTCFGHVHCPSSGVSQHCIHAIGICRASSVGCLLADSQQN